MSTASTKRKPSKDAKRQKKASPGAFSTILPALLVAIISVAAVGIFAPDAPNTIRIALARVAIPFWSKEQGELLLKEKPLFIVPKRLTDRTDPRTLIRTSALSLSQPDQDAFFALSYAKPNVSTPDIPFEIFQTNAISTGSTGTGLFPRTARLNHGCSKAFSAVYHWREDEGVLGKDIAKGQEILTTYTDTKRPRRDRQAYLREIYHFDCACSVCTLPEKESAASDKRLALMVDLRSMFAMWGKDEIKGVEAIKLARRIWSVGETEGYISERGQLAADAAHVAAGHRDATAARQWATLAHKWYAIELGPDSEQCRMALQISRMPESHGAWGSRKTEQVGGTEGLSRRNEQIVRRTW